MNYFILFLIIPMVLYSTNTITYNNKYLFKFASILLIVNLVVFFGTRTPESGTDTIEYINIYFYPDFYDIEKGFILLMEVFGFFGLNSKELILVLYLLPIVTLFFLSSYIFTPKEEVVFLILVTTSFTYFDLSSNVLRQFIASTFFISGFLVSSISKKHVFGGILCLLSASLHDIFIFLFCLYLAIICFDFDSKKHGLKNSLFLGFFFITTVLKINILGPYVALIFQLLTYIPLGPISHLFSSFEHYFGLGVTFGTMLELTFIGALIQNTLIVIPMLVMNNNFSNKEINSLYIIMSYIYFLLCFTPAGYRFLYILFFISPFVLILNLRDNITKGIIAISSFLILNLIVFYFNFNSESYTWEWM